MVGTLTIGICTGICVGAGRVGVARSTVVSGIVSSWVGLVLALGVSVLGIVTSAVCFGVPAWLVCSADVLACLAIGTNVAIAGWFSTPSSPFV